MWLAKAAGGMQWLGGGPNFVRNPLPLGFEPTGDLVVLGVGYDLGVTNRPGSRFGPRAIREQSVTGAVSAVAAVPAVRVTV